MQYKQLFYRAAMSLGEEAELLLDKIPDTEIQVMARTEMAAAWLNAPASPWFVQIATSPLPPTSRRSCRAEIESPEYSIGCELRQACPWWYVPKEHKTGPD